MFGCSKVYECRTYSDSFCNLPIYDHSKGEWASETVNFKAVNVDEAEAVCVEEYEYTFSGKHLVGNVVRDTTYINHPGCCACTFRRVGFVN